MTKQCITEVKSQTATAKGSLSNRTVPADLREALTRPGKVRLTYIATEQNGPCRSQGDPHQARESAPDLHRNRTERSQGGPHQAGKRAPRNRTERSLQISGWPSPGQEKSASQQNKTVPADLRVALTRPGKERLATEQNGPCRSQGGPHRARKRAPDLHRNRTERSLQISGRPSPGRGARLTYLATEQNGPCKSQGGPHQAGARA
ncbi:hypothetical protein PoB_007296900 [Plakobranchus ocellatus]|uniref:SpoVT-AbrB domain-containing protein n=1 Tax=Plakobranchus ocellatus TaxID=259542 RepID=A0AAV4DQH8_9GAST|nr:hypothetical protein PoB_007296900 [Plakobranchus ocellatus]